MYAPDRFTVWLPQMNTALARFWPMFLPDLARVTDSTTRRRFPRSTASSGCRFSEASTARVCRLLKINSLLTVASGGASAGVVGLVGVVVGAGVDGLPHALSRIKPAPSSSFFMLTSQQINKKAA